MNSVINITVFLLPGILAARIKMAFDPLFKDRRLPVSELESTIYAILNNLPAIFLGWALWSRCVGKWLTFGEWANRLVKLPDAFTFFVGSLGLTLTIEWWLKPRFTHWVAEKRNTQRAENGLPSFDDAEAWEVFLGSERELCMRITSLSDGSGYNITGILRTAFKPDDLSQGITLERTDEMAALDRWLYLPIRTYVDARTSLVYELFSQEQLKMAQILQREDNEHH